MFLFVYPSYSTNFSTPFKIPVFVTVTSRKYLASQGDRVSPVEGGSLRKRWWVLFFRYRNPVQDGFGFVSSRLIL